MNDLTLFLIVIGTIFVINVVSLIVAYNKYAEFDTKNKWTKTLYCLYFLLLGFSYWPKIWFENLVTWIKNKRA